MDATDFDRKIGDLFYLKTGYTYRERCLVGEVGAYRFFWNLTT